MTDAEYTAWLERLTQRQDDPELQAACRRLAAALARGGAHD